EELRAACQAPPEAPLTVDTPPPAAPTLVKYAAASPFAAQWSQDLGQIADELLAVLGDPDRASLVELAEPFSDPLREIAATLLYRYDRTGHSFGQIQALVADLPEAQVQRVFDCSMDARGRHDDLLREHRSGYSLVFDVLVDLGSFRDLHRHRRCVQVAQPWTWSHAFHAADEVFAQGLGQRAAESALEAGLGDFYAEALTRAERAAESVRQAAPLAAEYLLPLAYRTRCLFKMDW